PGPRRRGPRPRPRRRDRLPPPLPARLRGHERRALERLRRVRARVDAGARGRTVSPLLAQRVLALAAAALLAAVGGVAAAAQHGGPSRPARTLPPPATESVRSWN